MPSLQPDDVNEILRRAADLQARTRGTEGLTGLTQADLESLGQEIGIEPAFVAEALRQRARATPPAPASGGVFGGPGRIRSERVVPAPLTDAFWTEIVNEMRAVTGETGDTATVGASREWRHQLAMGGTTRTLLSATPAPGGTRVVVERHTAHHGGTFFAVPLLLVLLGTMLASMRAGLAGLGIGLVLFALTFLVGRFAYGRRVRGVQQDTEQLLDRLELTALREVAPATASVASGARLHLPEDDAPDTLLSDLDRTRTRT